jgi:hypothetical protein
MRIYTLLTDCVEPVLLCLVSRDATSLGFSSVPYFCLSRSKHMNCASRTEGEKREHTVHPKKGLLCSRPPQSLVHHNPIESKSEKLFTSTVVVTGICMGIQNPSNPEVDSCSCTSSFKQTSLKFIPRNSFP